MKYNLIALACALLLAAGLSLTVTAGPTPDVDTDGVPDSQDNCTLVPNATQGDSDLDGYGNPCDADYDNDGSVTGVDFNLFKVGYGGSNEVYDHDCDGGVGGTDFNMLKVLYGGPPGASGLGCAGTAPCPVTAHGCP